MSEEKYELIETEDGSLTIRHPEFDESTHTKHGAYTESLYKHVYPSQILERSGSVTVLDVGFGLGYNILALLCEATKNRNITHIDIHSFEYETSLYNYIKKILFEGEKGRWYEHIKEMFSQGKYEDNYCSLTLHSGDARTSILKLVNHLSGVDAVFHDPHSPGKNSELWTTDLFEKIHALMKDDGVLTTYSSALHIRQAMIDAGFSIAPNRSRHFVKDGTLAGKKNLKDTFDEEYISYLKNEIKATPFRDSSSLDLDRTEIFNNRLEVMNTKRTLRKK